MTFRDSLGSVIWVAALTFLCEGCGAPPTPPGGQPVPAEAPDSMPSTIFEDANLIEESTGDLVSTTILSIGFDDAASHAEKESAIRSVSGTVIGGVAGAVEGLYLVRIPGDGTIATIDSIAAELRSRPQVRSVAKFRWVPGRARGRSSIRHRVRPCGTTACSTRAFPTIEASDRAPDW